jgi:hypothetical protein
MSSYTYLLKYIIIGDPSTPSPTLGVGKSCALMQFLEGKFRLDSETTIGVEFGSKIVDIGDKKVKMQIWDTVPLPWIGLGRPGSVQVHHAILLPRFYRSHPHVRHHQPHFLQQPHQVARGNQELRQLKTHHHPRRQQKRSRK